VEKFKVEFTKRAAKDYKKIPSGYKALIDSALLKLSNGLPADIKPVIGEKDIYRLRIGKYRVLFMIIHETLLVTKLGPRGDIYK